MNTEFNWYTELNKATKSEPSEETYLYLIKRAGSWVTCACGELCKALPRKPNGQPKDHKLFKAGCLFAVCIDDKNWRKALVVLNKIEARTSQLLKEITIEKWPVNFKLIKP